MSAYVVFKREKTLDQGELDVYAKDAEAGRLSQFCSAFFTSPKILYIPLPTSVKVSLDTRRNARISGDLLSSQPV
jgi:hypothetical protein